jgi:hypothetical protein
MNLRTMLVRMAPATLHKIARDFGLAERQDEVSAILERCAAYRLSVRDLRERYPELRTDAGLRDR